MVTRRSQCAAMLAACCRAVPRSSRGSAAASPALQAFTSQQPSPQLAASGASAAGISRLSQRQQQLVVLQTSSSNWRAVGWCLNARHLHSPSFAAAGLSSCWQAAGCSSISSAANNAALHTSSSCWDSKNGDDSSNSSSSITTSSKPRCDRWRPNSSSGRGSTVGGAGGNSGASSRGSRGSPGQPTPSSEVPDTYELNAAIKACSSPQELQQLVQQHGKHMNAINKAAAITRLPKLHDKTTKHHQMQLQPVSCLQLLDQLWQLLQPELLQLGGRQLANILWASSKLQCENAQLCSSCLGLYLQCKEQHTPRHLSNVVYALCTAPAAIWQQHQAAVVQQLVPAFMQQLRYANAQDISNVMYGVAYSGQQLEAEQVQQLVCQFVVALGTAKPQNVVNMLWAVATMGQQVQPRQLQQLVAAFVGMLPQATPQNVSNLLWAMATMGQQVQPDRLQQMVDVFIGKLWQAKPQEVSNTLWACGKLGFLHCSLLSSPQLPGMLLQADSQHLANIAWACGQLGHRDEQLMAALLQEALQRLAADNCSSCSFTTQGLGNLCWAVAVLDMQQHADQVLCLVQACSQQWNRSMLSMCEQGLQQLWQVHTWLLDFQLAGGRGLAGTLTGQQLEQCKAAWDVDLCAKAKAAKSSKLQCSVFGAVQQLHIRWAQPPQMEQLSVGRDAVTDGALLIDITAKTASGVLLAIEVDGPWHFRQPDGGLMGTTQYRNRALEVRGYTVVSIPYGVWNSLLGDKQRQQYLLERLRAVDAV